MPKLITEKRKLTQEEIDFYHHKWESKYDYSEFLCTTCLDKGIIKCPEHGIFMMDRTTHRTSACPKCGRQRIKNKLKDSIEGFIRKANGVHNFLYDYSLINEYTNAHQRVPIICKNHGVFYQQAFVHLTGCHCPSCANESHKIQKNNLNKDIFITRSREIHGDRYDYSNAIYINCKTPTEIVCLVHGSFFQKPYNHFNKRSATGCPLCNTSKGEIKLKTVCKMLDIGIVTQKSFPDCKYKNPLKFDGFFPYFNVCIEIQGQQHYKPVRHLIFTKFSENESIENFRVQQIKDQIKRDYCKSKGIKLIEIPYWEFKNIQTILEIELNLMGFQYG